MWSWSGATTTSRTGRSSRRRFGAARLSPIPTVRERLCGGPRELLDPLSELLDLQAKVGDGIPGVRLGAGEERLQLDLGAIAHEIEELASFRLELLGPRGRAALCCVKHFLDAILQLVQLTRREHFRPPCDALRDDGYLSNALRRPRQARRLAPEGRGWRSALCPRRANAARREPVYSLDMDGPQTSPLPPPPQATEKAPVPALAPVPAPEAVPVQSLNDARFFINRELSWLAFDERVLEEACDPQVPALERLKFLAITSSNLDEFFMIRVAGLKQQLVGHVEETGPDALTPAEQLAAISARCHAMVARQYKALMQDVLPNLERAGVRLLRHGKLSTEADAFVDEYFWREVFPVLTPIALDPGHPFPHLRNKSLNLAVRFSAGTPGGRLRYGIIPVPSVLPRLVEVRESGRRSYALLEDVIARHAAQLFPGMPIEGCYPFRVTRNWDISIDEEEAEDLLVTIEREVRRRDRGSAVRLEIAAQAEQPMVDYLVRALKLGPGDVYRPDGPLDIPDLLSLLGRIEQKELHDEPFSPVIPPQIGDGERDLFRLIRERDVLLHHPYESFDPVVSFIEAAADDPAVPAIKMTLYRAGKDSPVVRALQRAADNGKQVTALVELKARMDEEANIVWARALEQAGVHVVYGLIGYKTHSKAALVVRRESAGLRRYVHLGTGNYNPVTARIYSDLSLFTAKEDFGADATSLFNLLTGYSKPMAWKKFKVA